MQSHIEWLHSTTKSLKQDKECDPHFARINQKPPQKADFRRSLYRVLGYQMRTALVRFSL